MSVRVRVSVSVGWGGFLNEIRPNIGGVIVI